MTSEITKRDDELTGGLITRMLALDASDSTALGLAENWDESLQSMINHMTETGGGAGSSLLHVKIIVEKVIHHLILAREKEYLQIDDFTEADLVAYRAMWSVYEPYRLSAEKQTDNQLRNELADELENGYEDKADFWHATGVLIRKGVVNHAKS